MATQGVISLRDEQVELLFGKIGTHSKCAGATLWLRDAFFSDFCGRKVTITAPSRRVAASALRTLLFQLSSRHGSDTALSQTSQWYYIDRRGANHGPYTFATMLKWSKRNAFQNDALPIKLADLGCWLPLWFLPHLEQLVLLQGVIEPDEVAMEDWEDTVRRVNEERSGKNGLLHAFPGGVSGSGIINNGRGLEEFPELTSSDAAAPMDYELSIIPSTVAPDGVRVFVVVDTNILLSHLTYLERTFERLVEGAPRIEVLLLVPWIVLNELDRLKESRGKVQADCARLALRRIRALTAERDTYLRAQTAAEHTRAIEAESLPGHSARELRNDDLILRTCLHWHRGLAASLMAAGHRAAVFLLSNDRGLCLRAQANGIRCFTAAEFPGGSPDALAREVPSAVGVYMDDSGAVEASTALDALLINRNGIGGGEGGNGGGGELSPEPSGTFHLPVREPIERQASVTSTKPTLHHQSTALLISSNEARTNPSPQIISTTTIATNPISDTQKLLPHGAFSDEWAPSLVVRYLAPAVKFYRQQDLGDLWIEMLEPELRPPWGAAEVLRVLSNHSTTFWNVLDRDDFQALRSMEKMARSRRAGGWGKDTLIVLRRVMAELLVALDKPLEGSTAPDPSEIPDFVSLGAARAGLEAGIAEIDTHPLS